MKIIFLVLLVSHSVSFASTLQEGWEHWKKGNVPEAEAIAKQFQNDMSDGSSARHLLALTSYVQGRYSESISLFNTLEQSYPRRSEARDIVVNALNFQNDFGSILGFLKAEGIQSEWLEKSAQLQIANPPLVNISGLVEIPFSDDSTGLTPYLPGFEAQIEGATSSWSGIARIDTGGTFLHMAPAMASRLGISTVTCTQGQQGPNDAEICFGTANLNLGSIKFRNIPVITVSTLPEWIGPIFGTRFLHNFDVLMEYPKSRLLLAPKSSGLLPVYTQGPCDEIPFYLWSDHYMFAKGAFGSQANLNFFIDTGLVEFTKDMRQAAIIIASEDLNSWGYTVPVQGRGVIDINASIELGPLSQSHHPVVYEPKGRFGNFGGVQIHGLLGHAFYKKYAWYVDFKSMKYRFCR